MKFQHSKTPGLLNLQSNCQASHHLMASGIHVRGFKQTGLIARLFDDLISSCSVGQNDDDLIDFLEEELETQDPALAMLPWKILIADDDSNVHDTTLLALSGVKIHGRPLEFLHAYSAKEARQLVIDHSDIALILLDVVMETVDAGLKLVSVIRNELGRNNLRIVLRTGQPGYAPEKQVNHEFAIDGYTTKSKLTRSILISVLNDTLSEAPPEQSLPN
ncbi:hypothetical protein LPB67_18280 [Undibacterium sp. Jales W-56]|uniref:hypothetical protein n=1 Tax=Undibacterium sp. Jales W-56 TaxID=2897325 RepID=UPI0021CEE9DB|nr:hypothetical protein [Undibacterium sp. Jales W-56]MCU6435729.1 hypothetical protein [Undibacterium sp. Jales W-56]